jgi:hypothetical protein
MGGKRVAADQEVVGTMFMERSQQQFEIFKSRRPAELFHLSPLRGQLSHAPHDAILSVLVGSFVRTEAIDSLGHERARRQPRDRLVEASPFRKKAPAGVECDPRLTF